jgi:filamentous hemagglutinin family protein
MNIINDNKNKLIQYELNPPNPSYIAGFIDGDGTIFIRKINDGYQSGISLSQSRTNILQILQSAMAITVR